MLDWPEIALFSQIGPKNDPGEPPVGLGCVMKRMKIILEGSEGFNLMI